MTQNQSRAPKFALEHARGSAPGDLGKFLAPKFSIEFPQASPVLDPIWRKYGGQEIAATVINVQYVRCFNAIRPMWQSDRWGTV